MKVVSLAWLASPRPMLQSTLGLFVKNFISISIPVVLLIQFQYLISFETTYNHLTYKSPIYLKPANGQLNQSLKQVMSCSKAGNTVLQ
ncbi:hypothetical protein MUP59_04235, partial [Candidatus Bathyarchaeota archaeon]|nr:hypothetical protein [Candidatus Bathyarchaeota archaeon]